MSSPEAADVVRCLLDPDPSGRPGARDFGDLSSMPFFAGVQWERLLDSEPPFVPELSSEMDDSYFESALFNTNPPSFASVPDASPGNSKVSQDSPRVGVQRAKHSSPRTEALVNVDQLLELTKASIRHGGPSPAR